MKHATQKNNTTYSSKKEEAAATEELNKRVNDQQPHSTACRTKTENKQTLQKAKEGVRHRKKTEMSMI